MKKVSEIVDTIIIMLYYINIFAALAQLVEHVICNLGVVGPSPTGSLQKVGILLIFAGMVELVDTLA